MKVKEYLRQYEHAARRAERFRKEYEQEMQKIDAVRSVSDNDGMPHGTGISKPTEEKAIRLAIKASAWRGAELEALAIRQEVFETISEIPGVEGEVLFARYIELKEWENIAQELHYSLRGIHGIHGRALQIVAEKLCI